MIGYPWLHASIMLCDFFSLYERNYRHLDLQSCLVRISLVALQVFFISVWSSPSNSSCHSQLTIRSHKYLRVHVLDLWKCEKQRGTAVEVFCVDDWWQAEVKQVHPGQQVCFKCQPMLLSAVLVLPFFPFWCSAYVSRSRNCVRQIIFHSTQDTFDWLHQG